MTHIINTIMLVVKDSATSKNNRMVTGVPGHTTRFEGLEGCVFVFVVVIFFLLRRHEIFI